MKNIIRILFQITLKLYGMFQISIIVLTWRYVDYKDALPLMAEDVNNLKKYFDCLLDMKYIVVAIVLFISMLLLFEKIKQIVKTTINKSIDKVDSRHESYSDSFSSFFIYDSIINKIVDEKIIKNMSEEELANILFEGKFLIKDLTRLRFDKEVIKRIIRTSHEC